MQLKKGSENKQGLLSHLNVRTVSAGTLAAIFGCTGPSLIIINGASNGELTETQMISWLFAIYFFGGILGILISVRNKQPIAGAYSIPGAVLVVGSLSNYSLNEAAGAYLAAGLIVFMLGIAGVIGKVMHWIPVPIVMSMVVGTMISFGTEMIASLEKAPIIAGSSILVYLLSFRYIKKFPPILISFAVAIILSIWMGEFQVKDVSSVFVVPQLVTPSFNIDAIISMGIPLALLVIGAENAQATGVLNTQGYKPPVNEMTILSGIGGVITSFFGGHNANIAGSMTAICASKEAGQMEGRYAAVVVCGVLFSTFGLFAGTVMPFVAAMPKVLISTVAGLAMMGVLLSSLQEAFSKPQFQVGSFFALIIAMSGVHFYDISSPFWAILGGVAVSLIIEKPDFKTIIQQSKNSTDSNVSKGV
ncbi:benzoate/H(+) symporter BenE family transporter [Peribacillus butanolivorans]|uniref:benzoate/H(+) symporter BenE family transporter n=1 Tax=Peribacillus butanolivorans TaxID=421767 RepID=UPI00167F93A2|nr:benzoate/H(+) symporter BenE family transporter [Peribacillus butanolivorans]QNU05355.1 benzoate/H(+) symporter BenE family transporter [Peribacillus butanolivorans]